MHCCLCRLLDKLLFKKGHIDFSVEVKPKEKQKMLQIACKTDQIAKVRIAPRTGAGKPAPVDGVPVWSVVSGNSTVVASADGLDAQLISVDDAPDGGVDVTVFKVTVDADLGAGVEELSDTVELSVTDAKAEALGLVMVELIAKP